jgi:hypothetical protein
MNVVVTAHFWWKDLSPSYNLLAEWRPLYQVLSPAALITCLALKAGKAGKHIAWITCLALKGT